MSGFKLGNISLGKSTKKYTRPLDFDNNTTMDFGFVQPLFCQLLLPDSDVSVSAKQLVRLAPMPCPSFARVSLVTKYVFVPWSDVCGYYEAMLSNMPYNGSVIPTSLPYTTNGVLMHVLLSNLYGTKVSVYKKNVVDGVVKYSLVSAVDGASVLSSLTEDWNDYYETFSNALASSFDNINTFTLASQSSPISPNSADYLYSLASQSLGGSYLFAFRFGTDAKHIRSILLGLGYSLALMDDNNVDILPIFAYCKAWFDSYSPKRSMAWTDTSIFELIKRFSDNYCPCFFDDDGSCYAELFDFLASCYYAQDDDFVSVHRSTIENVHARGLNYIKFDGTLGSVLNPSDSEQPYVSGTKINLIALDVVKRLTKFVAKDSIIGQKMSDWVRVHFNAQIANSLYEDVYQLSTSVLPLEINDVFSTSDTLSGDGGETLGAYAGKGIGFGNSGCKFHASKHGYLIALASIVPKGGYFQGTDTSLYGLDRFTLPSSDFDALGYEVTPNAFILGDNGYFDNSGDTSASYLPAYSKGFGFVPRFSGFKVKKSIVNGDMSRRGTINSMAPYYLDRILQTGDALFNTEDNNTYTLVKRLGCHIPQASDAWRYPTRYTWLGDFNRLFYNDSVWHGTSVPSSSWNGYVDEPMDDNFIVQSVFNMSVTDCLKPITMSYDTFDEDADNASVNVQPD